MTDHIDPRTCPPDQPYEGLYGGKRMTMQRAEPGVMPWLIIGPSSAARKWVPDDEVFSLVPLVPARPITRDDLPSANEIDGLPWEADILDAAGATLDVVVKHLNSRGGVPAGDGEDWEARAENAAPRPALDRKKVYDAIDSAEEHVPGTTVYAVDVIQATNNVMALCDEAFTDPPLSTVTDSDSDGDSEPEGEPLTVEWYYGTWRVGPGLEGVPFSSVVGSGDAGRIATWHRERADWFARAAVAIEKAEADEKDAETVEQKNAKFAEMARLEMGARWLYENDPGYGGTTWSMAPSGGRDSARTLFGRMPAGAQDEIIDAARTQGGDC